MNFYTSQVNGIPPNVKGHQWDKEPGHVNLEVFIKRLDDSFQIKIWK